eukprot:scaffold64421_cov31-Tisochrysis_lutea.AAC.2
MFVFTHNVNATHPAYAFPSTHPSQGLGSQPSSQSIHSQFERLLPKLHATTSWQALHQPTSLKLLPNCWAVRHLCTRESRPDEPIDLTFNVLAPRDEEVR